MQGLKFNLKHDVPLGNNGAFLQAGELVEVVGLVVFPASSRSFVTLKAIERVNYNFKGHAEEIVCTVSFDPDLISLGGQRFLAQSYLALSLLWKQPSRKNLLEREKETGLLLSKMFTVYPQLEKPLQDGLTKGVEQTLSVLSNFLIKL